MITQQLIEQQELRDGAGEMPEAVSLLRPVSDRHTQPENGMLCLQLLGCPELTMGNRPVVPRTRKTFALLAYLAIQGGRQPREHLADLFWPDADVEDARASLRTTLSYVRQALGDAADVYLTTTRESVGLDPTVPLDLDVRALAEAQQLARQSPTAGILRSQIEATAERYRGPFLADLSLPDAPDFEAWLEGQRAHWRGVAAEVLACLAGLHLQEGDFGAALTALERWTQVDPDEESGWQQLIELHLRRHDRAGARRAWQGYCETLHEVGAEPSSAMLALAERIDGDRPPLPVVDIADGRAVLDVRSLPFVGRSCEWEALLAAFERSRRGRPEVAILEGSSGTGKTRLISQFSQHVRELGADVLVGRALDVLGDLPYAAIVDALRARLESENAPDDLLGDLWLGELARLLPELRERYPDLPISMDDPTLARGRLFEAVARLGQALGERGHLVLCLDDAHWADAATRDLLRYALRRWTDSGTPILLIMAVRHENLDSDAELVHWIRALEREIPSLHLTLDALEREDIVSLLAGLAGSPVQSEDNAGRVALNAFGSWLAGRTGGHPLSLTETVQTLLEDSVLRVRPIGDGEWTVDIPDVAHIERAGRRTSVPAHSGTSPDRGTFAYHGASAPRHARVAYPVTAAYAMHTMAAAG